MALFATVAIISIATALQPTTRWRKFLYILPVYGIGLALIGVILVALRIGTVGPFAFGWLAIGGLLAVISSIIALLRLPLGERVARRALSALRVASLLGFLTGLCMIGTVLIVLTSTPSTAPNRQNDAQSQQGSQSDPGEQQEPGGPTGRQASTTPLLLGAALTTLFAGLAIASSARGARMLHGTGSADVAVLHSNSRYEAGRALFSAAALSIVLLAVAQLIPVRRDNPPAQNAVQWDSAATQQLARRACLDCHSNETTWPWYAYVAPGSWLLRRDSRAPSGWFGAPQALQRRYERARERLRRSRALTAYYAFNNWSRMAVAAARWRPYRRRCQRRCAG